MHTQQDPFEVMARSVLLIQSVQFRYLLQGYPQLCDISVDVETALLLHIVSLIK